ncbi:microtubule-associated tumor suppressor 1 homolog isoform X1 [Epinephelus fuscoguttatus]|uniref:microtubule-associated tumor suppressor 1 homolog isoform X1 n=1 Tax=Epinephelus fuscoguttatus TaxID=293821 RepID=UPI0020D1E880|nr:microtubule-associated tumor suppressor 1 homolog isoform X1 [Epinephelus fuscoguttatus]
MDVTEENLAQKEMCEEIAELNFSLNQQKDLNAKMRQWLDVSDDEMAMLRSDNAFLRKQVKDQEKIIREAQQVEAEPCRGLLADDLEAKKCLEKKIQELEKESSSLKEQNKQLTAELKSLQQERDRDKITLRKSKATLQALEWEMAEAELGLQVRDEVIHQRDLQLKYAKETVEECSNIIEDLRLTNQALKEQLEDRLDEASLATENDLMGGKEGPLSPPLSFALEMKLLASSAEVKTSMSDSTDLRNEETEKLRKPQSLTVERQNRRCAGILETALQTAEVFLLSVIALTVLAFVASGSCSGNFFPINKLWSGARLMLQPYCSVHYGALPPV